MIESAKNFVILWSLVCKSVNKYPDIIIFLRKESVKLIRFKICESLYNMSASFVRSTRMKHIGKNSRRGERKINGSHLNDLFLKTQRIWLDTIRRSLSSYSSRRVPRMYKEYIILARKKGRKIQEINYCHRKCIRYLLLISEWIFSGGIRTVCIILNFSFSTRRRYFSFYFLISFSFFIQTVRIYEGECAKFSDTPSYND